MFMYQVFSRNRIFLCFTIMINAPIIETIDATSFSNLFGVVFIIVENKIASERN